MCSFLYVSYKLLQVKTGQLVFSEYEVYVTEPLFKTAEEFSRQVYIHIHTIHVVVCKQRTLYMHASNHVVLLC